jgi:hypothetical protein
MAKVTLDSSEPQSSVSIDKRTDGSITYRVTVGKDYKVKMRLTAQKEFAALAEWLDSYKDDMIKKVLQKSIADQKKGT